MTDFKYNERLCKRISKGDEKAFIEIYEIYYDAIYTFILKYVFSPYLSQDLTHDVFLKVWEKRKSFKSVINLRAYVYKIARNHTLDYLKRVNLSSEVLAEIEVHYYSPPRGVEDQLIEKEYFKFLDEVIRSLPDRSQEIFHMCRKEKKTYQETASLLGVSKDTVKYHMVQSMRVMKKCIREHFDLADTLNIFICVALLI